MHKKKVLLIGAGGAVGMATRDAISEYLGATVLEWDRPLDNNPEISAKQVAERAERKEKYKTFLHHKDESLDGKQAKWLLGGYTKVDAPGPVYPISDLKEAIDQGVDCVVISAGAPRKGKEKRSALIGKNVKFFEGLGIQFADIAIEKVLAGEDFTMPVFINAGNPMDAMTEVFGRAMSDRIQARITEELTGGNKELAQRLYKLMRSLKGKVIGQGGILDSARAASAIHDVAKNHGVIIPLENILSVPVLATHNENMLFDLPNARVIHNGQDIALSDYPGIDFSAITPEINEIAKGGGLAVNRNYQTLTGMEQTAVFGAGAAVMQMVDAVIHKDRVLPAAIYNPPEKTPEFHQGVRDGVASRVRRDVGEGVVMGRMIKLGRDGVMEILPPPAHLADGMNTAGFAAKTELAEGLRLSREQTR